MTDDLRPSPSRRAPGWLEGTWLLACRVVAVWRRDGSEAVLRKVLRRLRRRRSDRAAYAQWIAATEPDAAELDRQRQLAQTFAYRPLISIISPVYDPPPEVLRAAIESVRAQTYEHWQLCVADGGSRRPGVRSVLDEYAAKDARIRVRFLDENLGISGNSNEALRLADGEFVALLDHDDLLAPGAFFAVVERLNDDPALDVLYSDFDLVTEDGKERFQPFFKPDWSPAIMLSANYMAHLCVMRARLVEEIGGFVSATDGAQDWDLFLRLSERTDRIAHIPMVLYHWRDLPTSAARWLEAKPYAPAAQVRAVQGHLDRLGLPGTACFEPAGRIRVMWRETAGIKVSIVIVTDGEDRTARRSIESILHKTTHPAFDVIVVDARGSGVSWAGFRDPRVRLVKLGDRQSDAAARNAGARRSEARAVVFLEDDLEIVEPDWLQAMIGWIAQKQVGVVGGRILTRSGFIERGGLTIRRRGVADEVFAGADEDHFGEFGAARWYRDHLAVSGACMMVARDVFEAVGGFREAFGGALGAVDLCLRVRARGYRVVVTPDARLRRLKGWTLWSGIGQEELEPIRSEHPGRFIAGDPYYSEALSPLDAIPQLRRFRG